MTTLNCWKKNAALPDELSEGPAADRIVPPVDELDRDLARQIIDRTALPNK